MKITDIVGKKIAVYDNSAERFHRLITYLEKFKCDWLSGLRAAEYNPYGIYKHVCIYITEAHKIRWFSASEAIENGFCLIPSKVLEDFAKQERRYESKQAEKIKKLRLKSFKIQIRS